MLVNDNMHAMTIELNETSLATISPDSKLKKYTASTSSNAGGNPESKIGLGALTTLKSDRFKKNRLFDNFEGQAYLSVDNVFNNLPFYIGLKNGGAIASHQANFNIQNFKNADEVIIDVESGKIIYEANSIMKTASKGERIVFNKETGAVTLSSSPKLNPFDWHKGILAFDNTSLHEVFNIIERYYGVTINVTDNSSVDGHFKAFNLQAGSLNDCLELLQSSIDMKIERKGLKTVEISKINPH